MATFYTVIVSVLFCLTYARGEDLQAIATTAEQTLQGAKTHVEHMLNLNPLPNQDKIGPIVKNESQHLAHEIKKWANQLQEKIAVGEHKPEVREAVNAAVTHLNEAAASLDHVGSDLKQDNNNYYAAAEKLLRESKSILAAGPCHEISPILKSALNELSHDVNNYQFGIHHVIGPHEGQPGNTAGHHGAHTHHVHQHSDKSSEESSEESSSSHHHHH